MFKFQYVSFVEISIDAMHECMRTRNTITVRFPKQTYLYPISFSSNKKNQTGKIVIYDYLKINSPIFLQRFSFFSFEILDSLDVLFCSPFFIFTFRVFSFRSFTSFLVNTIVKDEHFKFHLSGEKWNAWLQKHEHKSSFFYGEMAKWRELDSTSLKVEQN